MLLDAFFPSNASSPSEGWGLMRLMSPSGALNQYNLP